MADIPKPTTANAPSAAPAAGKPATPPAQASKKNIFSKPLVKKQGEQDEQRKKNKRGAYIRLAIAAALLIGYGVAFFFPQMQQYLAFESEISAIEDQIGSTEITLAQSQERRGELKAAYDQRFSEEQALIEQLFPEDVEKLEIIRMVEDFAAYTDATYGDFEFNSLSFQQPQIEKDYVVLPFQTSIKASRPNFDRFLGLVNQSGLLDGVVPLRLMEISQISLNYLGVDNVTGEDKGVNFNVSLKAYSQNTNN